MPFELRPIDASFFDTAPWRWHNVIELPRSAADVFALFDDAEAWPKWFKGIRKVTWTSPLPHGMGTTRTVVLDTVTVWEHFFRWEAPNRLSFYMTKTSLPLCRALAEDYLLEDIGPGRCRFTYVVAAEPTTMAKLLGPALRWNFARMFKGATLGLQRYLTK